MRRCTAALFLLACTPAFAASPVSGHTALAMGVVTGSASPLLGPAQKTILTRLLDGKAAPGKAITIKADEIRCQAGNVDISQFRCTLRFGARTVNLGGRAAHEMFATLGDIGIADDGAAGSVFRAIQNLSCKLDPAAITAKDGSGADCRYQAE